MANKNLELILKIRADGNAELGKTLSAIKGINVEVREGSSSLATFETNVNKVNTALKETASASGAAATGFRGVNDSWTTSVVKGTLIVELLNRAAGALKAVTSDTAQYAARTETLAIVTDQLAKVNNISQQAARGYVGQIKALGITTQESHATVQQFIFAQLDLAKATDIARLAQDAAVIAGKNSSETLAGIIHGIRSQQTEVLRTYGIAVNFEQAYIKNRRELGRELTATEKQNIALNEVLKEGIKISGTYEAALGTVGKKLGSLQRFIDEAKNALGKEFLPILGKVVDGLTEGAKFVEAHSRVLGDLAKAVGLATAAYALFRIGKVIGDLTLAGHAATTAAVAFRGLSVAILSNPVGLALVGVSALLAIAIKQASDLRNRHQEMFDVDEAGAKSLEEKLKTITDRMREGKATADEFHQAVVDALNAGTSQSIGNDVAPGVAAPQFNGTSNNDRDFQKFVKDKFQRDPALIQQMIDDGNKAGIAMARAMQQSFVKERVAGLKDYSLESLGIKIFKPKSADDVAAEQVKSAKVAQDAAREVLELEQRAFVGQYSNLQKINAEREVTLKTVGVTGDLITRINRVYEQMAVNETKDLLAKALGLQPETLRSMKTAAEVLERVRKASSETAQRSTLKVAQETLPDVFGEKKIKTGVEALEDSARNFQFTLKQAIDTDEKFLAEAKKVADAFRNIEEARIDVNLNATRANAARMEQMIGLTTASGNEAVGNTRVAALRAGVVKAEFDAAKELAETRRKLALDTAKTEQDIIAANANHEADLIRANGDLKQRMLDLEFDKVARVLELRRKEVEDFRNSAGQIFDALETKGSSGLKDWIGGYVKTVQKSLFVNGAEEVFKGIRGIVPQLPGLTDGKGGLSFLGRIARGTPFGADPAKLAAEAEMAARKDNTSAVKDLTRTIKMAGQVAAAGVNGSASMGQFSGPLGDALSIFGSDVGGFSGGGGIIPGLGVSGSPAPGSKSGGFLGNLLSGISSAVSGGLFSGFRSGDYSVNTANGTTTASALGMTSTAGRAGNIIGSAGAVAGATYGVINGVQRGGAGGYMQAGSSALGLAASIPGPQQPFLMAGALILGAFSSMFGGDKKKSYSDAVDAAMTKNRRDPLVGSDRTTDTFGGDIDYDYRGRTRTVIRQTVQVNVNAIDSKSFLDRSADVAAAFQKELSGGNDGLRNTVQIAALS